MRGLDLSRRAVAVTGGALLLLAGAGAGVGVWLKGKPVLHLASTAQECINAPDHVATLFSDDQNTLIRISKLDYSDQRVLRVEPAATLPGLFNPLLALSSDSRRLAYVTAGNPLMDDARIQYLDVGNPDPPHPVAEIKTGLAPVRPAWAPDRSQLAYVVGRPATDGQPAGFEVWSARVDGAQPAQKVANLPVEVFARGHSAALCFTPAGEIGLLQGVESAQGPVGPSPLSGNSAASAARSTTPTPSVSPTANGSPCGVPIFSQNDPSWRHIIMQAGGDAIGGFGCALTSTTMLLNYYGAVMSPVDLNMCLGPDADPIYWASAPGCTAGKVQGGLRADFSWEAVDAFLKAGRPIIIGMVRGQTGMHFVVVTQGGGGEADNYHITDPWDGSTSKTLGSYTSVGYNPRWIISYDGPGKNCGRLVPGGQSVQGFRDGGTYKNGVVATLPSDSDGDASVQKVPGGQGDTGQGASPSPSVSPSATVSPTVSPSASTSTSPVPSPSPSGPGKGIIRLRPGGKVTLQDEGVYLVYLRRPGPPPRVSILKFTIDHTPPVLSLQPLNAHAGTLFSTRAAGGGAFTAYAASASAAGSAGPVLDRPGQLRLGALDTLSGVDQVEYRLDGAGVTPYSDDVSFRRTLSVPAVGPHVITILARDVAGNASELVDQPFEVVDVPTPTPTPSPSASPTPTPTRTPVRTPTPVVTPTPTSRPTPTPPVASASLLAPSPNPPAFCPVTYTVSGSITMSGAGTVQYVWVHNGVRQASQTLDFSRASSIGVTDFVRVTGGTVTEQLLVLTPNTASSPQISLNCFVIGSPSSPSAAP